MKNPNSRSKSETVLIVDDSPENLSVLGQILLPYFNVRVANNGNRAINIAGSDPAPDIILLDIMMPEMDGYEVLRSLKSQKGTENIPVIFVTALNEVEDERRGIEMGAVDYLTKPVSPPIALARIRSHLDLSNARKKLMDQNDWLESEVQRRMMQNQKMRDVTLRALASLAEVRDKETGAHILRTQNYVRLLAERLALTPEYADQLDKKSIDEYARAAPLHDIGKVGIPDVILHKNGKLTEAEMEVMKTHAALGAEAISKAIIQEESESVGFLLVAMKIARYHHEKWDGSGYPEGLTGKKIPLPARLMALADVYDALVTRRVYKDPIPPEVVEGMIIEQSGRHFDPEVVQAFVAVKESFVKISEQYPDEQV
jgi:putative two-component system response regulator